MGHERSSLVASSSAFGAMTPRNPSLPSQVKSLICLTSCQQYTRKRSAILLDLMCLSARYFYVAGFVKPEMGERQACEIISTEREV